MEEEEEEVNDLETGQEVKCQEAEIWNGFLIFN